MRIAYSNRHWIIGIGRFAYVATTRDKAFSFIKEQLKGEVA